ncbi:MAG: helix-turn-helix domain-containing protein [Pseudomonadota bacterium]
MKFPKPGSPVRGSKTGEPIMALFDLLGRSWAMGIVWQLADRGPANFRELQDRCEGVSPAVLNTRLKELRAAGLLEHGSQGYQVTKSGKQLFKHLSPLARWSSKWAHDLET